MSKIDLSIVIVSYNTKKLIKECLDSVYKYVNNINFEVIVVDNGSTDGSSEYLSKESKQRDNFVLVENSENLGFSGANNQGMKLSRGEYVLLLNSDTYFSDSFLDKYIDHIRQDNKIGISSCALKNKDGSLQGSGGYFPNLLRVFSWMTIQDLPLVDNFIKPFHPMKEKFSPNKTFYEKEQDLDWVTGAFFMIRRDLIEKIGFFDESYFMYTEEVDYCFRAVKEGFEVKYLPQWSIIHLGGASSTREFAVLNEYKGVKRFYKKHYPNWQYPFLVFLLKIGALWRMVVLGIIEGKEARNTYAKAFIQA